MPCGVLFEMLHRWTNLLGHVARGQGDKFDWHGGEMRIASAFGGTWSTLAYEEATELPQREEDVSEWDGGAWTWRRGT